jgi:hypothetical protein
VKKPVSKFAFQMQPAALHNGKTRTLPDKTPVQSFQWWGCTSVLFYYKLESSLLIAFETAQFQPLHP